MLRRLRFRIFDKENWPYKQKAALVTLHQNRLTSILNYL